MKRILYSILLSVPLFLSQAVLAQTAESNDSHTRVGNFFGPTDSPFSLYPLPSTGVINIAFTEDQNQAPDIEVFDLLGNRIAKMKATTTSDNNYAVDLSDKKPGYYFLKIASDGKVYSRRITIRP